MDIFEVLRKPERIRIQIKKCAAEIEGLHEAVKPKAIRYDTDRVQSTGQTDPMAIYACRLEEKENELKVLQKKYFGALEEVEKMVKYLRLQEATVITLRYVKGESFAQIADEMHRSERSIFRDHKRAITALKNKSWQ
ncbi:sigma factor-like helix-turn-helix DNA-binding protein [Bacillota bacterium HCP3S3_E9]